MGAPDDRSFWCPAKRYGWGWGLPVKWQGWVVLVAYIAIVVAGSFRFPPSQSLPAFLAVVLIGSLVFGLVCWWKGEPPRWRWGGDEN